MNAPNGRVLFEIYREPGPAGVFRVVYFTELDEHQKELEIGRAMAGRHVFDGFIADNQPLAKAGIERVLIRLNAGEHLEPEQIETELQPYLLD